MEDSYYSYDAYEGFGAPERRHKKGGVSGSKIFFLLVLIAGIVLSVYGLNELDIEEKRKLLDKESIEKTFSANEVENLEITAEIENIKLVRVEGSDIKIHGEAFKDALSVSVDNGILKIETKEDMTIKTILGIIVMWRNDKPELVVELPDKLYDEVRLELDGGEFTCDDLDCNTLKTQLKAGDFAISNVNAKVFRSEISAGELEIKGLKCDELHTEVSAGESKMKNIEALSIEVKIGAGELKMKDCISEGLDARCSAGEMRYSGAVNGDIHLDVSAGDIDLDLTNPESDYSIDGLSGYSGSDGKYVLKVTKSAGDVDVHFGK